MILPFSFPNKSFFRQTGINMAFPFPKWLILQPDGQDFDVFLSKRGKKWLNGQVSGQNLSANL
jgi:hypothetical protein